MPTILLNGCRVHCEIIRHARRQHLALEAGPDNSLVVRAPMEATDADISRFLSRCTSRIVSHLTGGVAADGGIRRRVQDGRGVIEFRLLRRRGRRRISLMIHPRTGPEVRAPLRASVREIDSFVLSKADWVREKMAELAVVAPARQWVSGERLLFAGKHLTLHVEEVAVGGTQVEHSGLFLWVRVPAGLDQETRRQTVRAAVRQWYADRALEAVQAKLPEFATRIGVQPRAVRVKDMSSRWGSCSPLHNISISFRIVMATPGVMDYLLVHELCHLKHLNHSRAFWGLVESVLPDYKRHKAWLRAHEREMEL